MPGRCAIPCSQPCKPRPSSKTFLLPAGHLLCCAATCPHCKPTSPSLVLLQHTSRHPLLYATNQPSFCPDFCICFQALSDHCIFMRRLLVIIHHSIADSLASADQAAPTFCGQNLIDTLAGALPSGSAITGGCVLPCASAITSGCSISSGSAITSSRPLSQGGKKSAHAIPYGRVGLTCYCCSPCCDLGQLCVFASNGCQTEKGSP